MLFFDFFSINFFPNSWQWYQRDQKHREIHHRVFYSKKSLGMLNKLDRIPMYIIEYVY